MSAAVGAVLAMSPVLLVTPAQAGICDGVPEPCQTVCNTIPDTQDLESGWDAFCEDPAAWAMNGPEAAVYVVVRVSQPYRDAAATLVCAATGSCAE